MSNNTTSGFWVRILMPDGEPEGLRIIEKSNWTGQGIVFSRALLPKVKTTRGELKKTGIYILWESVVTDQLPTVYIGEGGNILSRLVNHEAAKDFWTHAVGFVSKDQDLNKAHIQYIEFRLYQLATEAKRCELENNQVPQPRDLSEADIVYAEGFLQDILLCLPVINLNVFEKADLTVSKDIDNSEVLFIKTKGIQAQGIYTPSGFVVLKDSQVVKGESLSIPRHLKNIRQILLGKQLLVDQGNNFYLSQDYTFNSPSTAAGVLLGQSANGRTTWKNSSGVSLKQLQEQQLKNQTPLA